MAWNDLVTTTKQVEAKAHIYNNTHLDQKYPKGKQLLKMKDSSQKEQLKTGAAIQGKTNSPNQLKASKKIRKEKDNKKKIRQRQ